MTDRILYLLSVVAVWTIGAGLSVVLLGFMAVAWCVDVAFCNGRTVRRHVCRHEEL